MTGFSNENSHFVIHYADGSTVTVEKPIEGLESKGKTLDVVTKEFRAVNCFRMR